MNPYHFISQEEIKLIIYKITNKINDKIYIGQTTLTLQERIYNYRKEYKWSSNIRPIIAALRKYGIENFNWEIIDYATNKQELDEKERCWIKKLNTLVPNGYNIEIGGNGPGKHNEETRKKIGDAQKGALNHMYGKTGKLNKMSKPIIDLCSGKIYESVNLYAQLYNASPSHLCAVAREERGSHKGLVIRYIDENNQIITKRQVHIKFKNVRSKILPQFSYLIK